MLAEYKGILFQHFDEVRTMENEFKHIDLPPTGGAIIYCFIRVLMLHQSLCLLRDF